MFLHFQTLMFRSRVLSRLCNRYYLNTVYRNGKKHLILINDAIFCRNTFVWYVYILCFLTALHVAVVAAELVNALESMLPEVVTQYWLLVQVEVPHLHVFEEHVFEESLSHPTPPQRHWHIPRLENGLRPPSHETPEQGSVYIDYSQCN